MIRWLRVVGGAVLLFLVGFVVGVYLLFPYELLTSAVHAEVGRQLPDFIQLQKLDFRFPATLNLTPLVHLHPIRVHVPLTATPVVEPDGIVIHFSDTRERNLNGRYNPASGTLNLNVKNYPIQNLLPGQTGTIEGTMQLRLGEKPAGEFRVGVSVDSLKSSRLVPAFLEGRRLRRVRVVGTVNNNTISINTVSVKSSGFAASGTGELRLVEPISQSRMSVDVNITSPVNRRIQQTMTIEALQRLVSG